MKRWSRAVMAVAVIGLLVAINPNPAMAASPSLTAPERLYGLRNTDMPFVGDDPISGDHRPITVEATDLGTACDTSANNNYAIGNCPRIQMDVDPAKGSLKIGVDTNLSGAGQPDGVATGGAIFESTNDDGTGPVINLNGTETQLNDALATLVFVPATDYENDYLTPAKLHLLLVDDDDVTNNIPHDVEIRIDELNQGPTLTVPGTQFLTAGDTIDLPAVAPPVATPPTPGDFDVTDPDVKQGDPNQMLFVAFVTCGEFSMRGVGLPVQGLLEDTVTAYVDGIYGNDPSSTAERQAIVDAIIAALPPEVGAASIQTSDANVLKTGYAGIGEIDDLVYMLSQVSFKAPATDGNCQLWSIVTDLGNDGLPLQYIGSPLGGIDDPQPGLEVPDLGLDVGVTDFVVGDGAQIDVPPTLDVNEGASVNIPITITQSNHQAFNVNLSTADVSTTGADYTPPLSPASYPLNDPGPVNVAFAAATDGTVEGDEVVNVSIQLAGEPEGLSVGNGTVAITIHDADTTTTTSTTTSTSTPDTTTSTSVPDTSTSTSTSTTTSIPDTTTSTSTSTTTTTIPDTTTSTSTSTTTSTSTSTTSTTSTTTTTIPDTTTSTSTSTSTTTTSIPDTTTTSDPGTTTTTGDTTTTTGDTGSTTTTQVGDTTTTAVGDTTTTIDAGVSNGGVDQGTGSSSNGGSVSDGSLARTGAETGGTITLGLVLLAIGTGSVAISRRVRLNRR